MKVAWGNKISRTMLKNGTTKGSNNPAYIDNRTNKKYYCKDCDKSVIWQTVIYGKGRCRSCSTKRQVKGKNNPNYKYGETLKKHYCIDCHKLLVDYKAKRCKKCSYIWKKKIGQLKGRNNPMFGKKGKLAGNYINGQGYFPYSSEFNYNLKYQIRERDNFECQNCGMTEEEHLSVYGRVLEVHHIDYNKDHNLDYNLITLCKQCNIRANYNRKYWQIYYQNKLLQSSKKEKA
jgi:hypothetical protein